MCWPSQKNADDGKRNLPLDPIKRGNSINLWSAEDCVWRPWRSNNFSVIYLQPTALSRSLSLSLPLPPLSLASTSGPCNRNVPKSSVEWARLIWKFKQLKQQQRRQRRQRKWKATSWKACWWDNTRETLRSRPNGLMNCTHPACLRFLYR